MATLNFSKYIIALLAGMFFIIRTQAQDSTTVQNCKYVMLVADRNNNAAPDYHKFKANLEEGIKELLVGSQVHVLKYKKGATEKNLQNCDTLTCTYAINYNTGLMLNARIKCSLTFTDRHKNEVYTISAGKMTGAVVTADAYLKLFEKLIKPDLMKHLVVAK